MRPAGYRKSDVALIMERARSVEGARENWRPEGLLPLSDAAYVILLVLGAPWLSEGGSMKTLEEAARARGVVPGTLMSTLERLTDQGLVAPEAESRERQYRVTGLGSAVLYAESGRRRRFAVQAEAGISRTG